MKTKIVGKPKVAHRPALPPPSAKPAEPKLKPKSRQGSVSSTELQHWLDRAKDMPDIRWAKVQAMRDAILADGYDTEERLAKLADRLPTQLFE